MLGRWWNWAQDSQDLFLLWSSRSLLAYLSFGFPCSLRQQPEWVFWSAYHSASVLCWKHCNGNLTHSYTGPVGPPHPYSHSVTTDMLASAVQVSSQEFWLCFLLSLPVLQGCFSPVPFSSHFLLHYFIFSSPVILPLYCNYKNNLISSLIFHHLIHLCSVHITSPNLRLYVFICLCVYFLLHSVQESTLKTGSLLTLGTAAPMTR